MIGKSGKTSDIFSQLPRFLSAQFCKQKEGDGNHHPPGEKRTIESVLI
jgi:hypothetical protein